MKRLLPLLALPFIALAATPAMAFSTEASDGGQTVSSGTPHLNDPDEGNAAQFGLDDDGQPLGASARQGNGMFITGGQTQDPPFLGQNPNRGR